MNAQAMQISPAMQAEIDGEALASSEASHSWQRPEVAQPTYRVIGTDSAVVRVAATWFGRSSTTVKLWTIGSIPFATSVIMTLPVLLAASALQEAAHAGGPDAHVHIAQASHLRNIAGGAIILGAILSWFTVAVLCRDIVTVVTDVIKAAYNIIEGKLDTPTPHRNRNDEYGQIACAFDALRERSKTIKELEDQRWTVAAAREEERTRLVAAFERSLGDVVTSVASAASQLHSTAGVLAAGTDQAREQTDVVSRAIDEAASGTTAAAAASDEFAMSIGEISRQASSSAELARKAREAATSADGKISQLTTAAGEIGEIVGLIQSIAQRTNLLALNASIEAARGGEAGRGFAVVASEVKELAAQTSRATDRVAQQITAIQTSTGQSVKALHSIGEQVKELELTAISIASAVDQQSVAGQDLARSLDMAARATDEVSVNIGQVRDATRNTGIAASQVLQSADELERQAGTLRSKSLDLVSQFRSRRS
jgi:methyl-accepting chemotaxis protein